MSEHSRDPNRYKGLPSWAIRRPIGTMMLTSVVLVLGVFSLRGLPLDLLPSIVYPTVRAGVNNPGVDPEVMEETIAKPLEAALAVTEGLTRITTEVQEGRVGVNLEFAYGTNIDFALQDAAKNLERVRSQLPEEADPPTINKFDPSQLPIYEVVFSSSERDLVSLREWVENRLRPQLLTIDGVASVDVSGGLIREIQILLDQERLRAYGLTVVEVINALRAENQDVAAGRVSSSTREVVGVTAGKYRNVEEIRGTLLNLGGGNRIPLSEVAEVRDTNREQRLWARLDGVPAVRMNVRKQPDANTVAVAEGIADRIASLEASRFVPGDIRVQTLNNQADFIRSSVNGVRNAALSGAFLAMMVVMVFLASIRKTVVIGLAIPIAIVATFMMMGAGNLTLNIMSLGGLALGVGLLIDNSIVMLENIFRHKEDLHEDSELSAHSGASEVTSAVVAATATNLAAVVPFLLISGLAALIFRELILTISFAILGSLAVALTVVPTLSAQLGKIRFSSGLHEWRIFRFFDGAVNRMKDGYRAVAPAMVRGRWAILGVGFLSLGGAWFLTRDLGSEFLPQVDDGNVGAFIRLPQGSPPEAANLLVQRIEAMVQEMPDVEAVFATAGGQTFGSFTVESAGRGSMDVRLVPRSERSMTADQWVQMMQGRVFAEGFPGARVFFSPPRIRGLRTNRQGSPIALTIVGEELDELETLGQTLLADLRGIPGLQNLQASSDEVSPQIAIELDRERAAFLGLNVQTVGQTLRTALDGTVATRFTEGVREFDVRVMFPRERFDSPEALGQVALFPGVGGGDPIYLRDVARIYPRLGPTSINRENQNRIYTLTGDVITEVASVGQVNDAIRARLAELDIPEGYSVIIGGEEEAMRENSRQLAIVIALAIFLVFVVMAVQYESVVNPLVILMSIPMSLVGVGVALWITNTTLSAPVLLGVILLAGIVVNNAILLVEYIEQFRKEGHTREEAVMEAGAVRLRPILMTTLTTTFGMLPLALGIGQGSELMQPLAVAVVGGLLVSAFLTLFVVPSAYLILNGGAERLQTFLVGSRSAPAGVVLPQGGSEVATAGD
jgi:CzcA family heavy metal efflux pump